MLETSLQTFQPMFLLIVYIFIHKIKITMFQFDEKNGTIFSEGVVLTIFFFDFFSRVIPKILVFTHYI